jgi:hypothetical protein
METLFMENITKTAQEAANKLPELTQNAADNLAKALQNLTDNLAPIIDRLAGTQTAITLSFKDLTLDTGKAKATLTGAINLQTTYTEQQGTSQVERTAVT